MKKTSSFFCDCLLKFNLLCSFSMWRGLFNDISTEVVDVENKYVIIFTEKKGDVMENQKDVLFYSDLVYYIRKLAGFEVKINQETDERIEARQLEIEQKANGMTCYGLSEFTLELFQFVSEISKQVDVVFRRIDEICKYPNVVEENLKNMINI